MTKMVGTVKSASLKVLVVVQGASRLSNQSLKQHLRIQRRVMGGRTMAARRGTTRVMSIFRFSTRSVVLQPEASGLGWWQRGTSWRTPDRIQWELQA
ncbi:MAG: hypothetical protein H7318_04635 [Oligoflexus sp.]|nr:hypothetical protein [Oligoflexus sp.]